MSKPVLDLLVNYLFLKFYLKHLGGGRTEAVSKISVTSIFLGYCDEGEEEKRDVGG